MRLPIASCGLLQRNEEQAVFPQVVEMKAYLCELLDRTKSHPPLHCVPRCVGALELQSHPWSGQIRCQCPGNRSRHTVKQQVLDPHVIVEVLDVRHA